MHLLNPSIEPSLCCGMMDIHDGCFERSYEYMEEIVPVHDLRIVVRGPGNRTVRTLREKSPFTVREVAEGMEIIVIRVGLWEIVEISRARA